ncbi:hydroxyisourate hydrolase [Pseudonocardia pini]|uniref:hydroxyisourate hydrolase n=1 Tax=Pseudonocardia pini TaxID=2758030 RepID=UPI0015F124BF|nr:hydroxyisourate hydrolase [Pseudonocardia pini]
MSLSTHVLDATTGTPAAGMTVVLRTEGRERERIVTDADGRGRLTEPGAGVHTLTFATAAWSAFYPEVTVAFTVTDPQRHHHVPLLLSPFAYSTYRGS